ncbi:4'-phosphopantetheinyl transferase family protein [Micromonospora sp. NPDC049275]|uniref:4'-phosphopantetheinyl transferase family protein n=1 Tax=Micromonospora sp. NPDC049275 TaxID=3364268 RepID=UPI00371CB42A
MGQLTASDRDTAYVWVGRDTGGRPDPARGLLLRAGSALLGRSEAELVLTQRPGGSPVLRVGGPVERVRMDGPVERGRQAEPADEGRRTGPVELPVSVSRTDGVVVVAARLGGPVGVDVERVRPLPALALARRWFPPAESSWLAARPEVGHAVDFLRLWTAKEAAGKALGLGLRDGGLRREMPLPVGPALRALPGHPTLRVGHPEVGPDLVLAVAVRVEEGVDLDVEVVQRAGHGVAAERSAPVERTSLPVVVRGN